MTTKMPRGKQQPAPKGKPAGLAPADHDPKRAEIIAAVAGHLVREGFANSGIRALAESAGISDRMLIYYFETKDALIASALMVLARNMSAGLDLILPRRTFTPAYIVEALVQSVVHEEQKAVLRLWFEIIGLAIRGQEPYRSTVSQILTDWEAWIADRLRAGQKDQASSVLAQIEGALLLALLES